MVFSEYNDQKNILFTNFEGNVSSIDIVNYINSTKLNKKHPRKLRIITDSRKSKMTFNQDEVIKIVQANNDSLKAYDCIIDAIILENSQDAVLSLFYQELSRADNYYFKLFANYEKALNWLLNFKAPK